MIHRKLGVAYNALLGIGLVVEIGRHLLEARDLGSTGMIRAVLAVTLFVLLLLHQWRSLPNTSIAGSVTQSKGASPTARQL